MTPVTLHTLQAALGSGQIVVTPMLTDSLYAVMTIGKREVGIAGTPVPIDSMYAPESGFRRLVKSFAALPLTGVEGFLQNPDRLWYSRAVTGPLVSVSGRYDHFLVVSDPLMPFSVLGTGNYIAYEKRFPWQVLSRKSCSLQVCLRAEKKIRYQLFILPISSTRHSFIRFSIPVKRSFFYGNRSAGRN